MTDVLSFVPVTLAAEGGVNPLEFKVLSYGTAIVVTIGLFALLFALAKHWSDEDAIERAQQQFRDCPCATTGVNLLGRGNTKPSPSDAYVEAAERRFNGPNRCC